MEAGMRTEPPPSVPMANAATPAATTHALPPLRWVLGWRVGRRCAGAVCEASRLRLLSSEARRFVPAPLLIPVLKSAAGHQTAGQRGPRRPTWSRRGCSWSHTGFARGPAWQRCQWEARQTPGRRGPHHGGEGWFRDWAHSFFPKVQAQGVGFRAQGFIPLLSHEAWQWQDTSKWRAMGAATRRPQPGRVGFSLRVPGAPARTCIWVLPMHTAPRLRSAATQGASDSTSGVGPRLPVDWAGV
jgi:hypothetical protein